MKHCLLSIDDHFFETPDGKLWTQSIVDNAFWNKYLEIFDQVTCFVRVQKINSDQVKDYIRFENSRVNLIKIPMFRDVKSFIKNQLEVKKIINNVISNNDFNVAIIRVPSVLGGMIFKILKKSKFFPIGVEVVSSMRRKGTDKWNAESIKKIIFQQQLKSIISSADGVSFVTSYALQKLYQTKSNAITAHYSSIDLFDDFYFSRKTRNDEAITLLHISTLNSYKKGVDIFLFVVKKLIENGIKVKGIVVGGGSLRDHYIQLSEEISVKESVEFIGNISKKEDMRSIYCKSDILLFPSEYEGLPRTVIEAMATSMVCVTSNVDGLVELVEEKYTIHPKNVDGFYQSIVSLINDRDEYFRVSERNFKVAQGYNHRILRVARNEFFEKLLELKHDK